MDFKALNPELRTVALVGTFLQQWAFMEGSINIAIGKALKLDDLQALVVAKNVQFRDKIHILRTAISLSFLPASEREEYDKLLNSIAGSSHVRNMMAHDIFGPGQKTDGVEFLVVKAKGELNFPQEDWSIATFEEWFGKLRGWDFELKKLAQKPMSHTLNGLLADLLMAPATQPAPTPALDALAAQYQVPLHPQGIPDSVLPEAMPEKDDENPPTPQGK